MFSHFLDTVDTIPEGFGFSLFGPRHLIVLALFLLFAVLCCLAYRRADEKRRLHMRRLFAVLLLADELFKHAGLLLGGNFDGTYLPLHLCSVNIFLITLHAWRPSRTVSSFLYFVCIPAAMAALLTPTWTSLPVWNFMFLHSTSVHMLLAAYPIMLFSGGDLHPRWRDLGRCLALLAALAVPAYVGNRLFGANFMFLMSAPAGSPFVWFQTHWGSHLLGLPVLIAAAVGVMSLPLLVLRRAARRDARLPV